MKQIRKWITYPLMGVFMGLFCNAQNVGIGTTSPDPSAILDISAPDKGLLVPRVSLQSLTSYAPITTSPALSLLIFNDGQGGVMPPGFYWWDGTKWKLLMDSVATVGPLSGFGTPTNPIGLQPGINAGDALLWNGTQWVSGTIDRDSVCNGALANYLQKWTGLKLCNSQVYDDGTNVGIGTSSPAATLDVNGTVRIRTINPVSSATASDKLLIANNNGDVQAILFTGSNSDYLRGDGTWGTISGGDNWGTQVAITSAPIIGDGTTGNPITLQSGTAAGDVLVWNGSQWVIQSPDPSNGIAPICSSPTMNFVQKWTGSTLCDGIIYDNGTNVGIGTTSPAEKLTVAGDVRIVSGSDVTATLGTGALYVVDPALSQGLHIDVNEIQTIGVDLFVNRENISNTIVNNTLYVLTSGNVGIGRATPAGKLHISKGGGANGDAVVFISADEDDTNEDANPALVFEQDGGQTKAWFYFMDNSTYGNNGNTFALGYFNYSYDSAVIAVKLNSPSNAYVGIGTYAPREKLDVHGEIRGFWLESSTIVKNSYTADSLKPIMLSALYCRWNSSTLSFDTCRLATPHSWGGRANFDISAITVSGNQLTIPFITPYSADPICHVDFEDVFVLHRINPQTSSVVIRLANPGGTALNWSSVTNTWVMVSCMGVR